MFEKRHLNYIKKILNLKNGGWKVVLRFGLIIAVTVLIPTWTWLYLRPDTWEYYTDEIEFSRIKNKSEPQFVVWDDPNAITGTVNKASYTAEPAISPDGSMMAFTRRHSKGNSDIFFSKWNGKEWQAAVPARAINSQFSEKGPAFSRDGKLLFFTSDRPGGPGGFDIWVSRWDGAEFAWPVPLTIIVNSPYDETGPSPSATDEELFFSSNRPRQKEEESDENDDQQLTSFIIEEKQTAPAEDFDIFSAHIIPSGVTNKEVERAISMLYYLREAALADETVMKKLGGSRESEKAIDRALEYLKAQQEEDGSWRLHKNRHGKHDVARTSLALLTFFGRGHRHDRPGQYQQTIAKGLDWLIAQQKPLGEIYGKGDFYDQGIGTLALGEAYGLTKDERIYNAAHTSIDYIVECQNEDGGWRYKKGDKTSDLSVSGWMIMALKNAELSGLYVPDKTFEGIRKWLTYVGKGEHGGNFGYQGNRDNRPAMRVTGYFCSQLMGLSPNTMKSFEAAEEMLKRGPMVNDFYYLYYGTLAANQHQGPLWKKWQKDFPAQILPLQKQDGSWDAKGVHAGEMKGVVGTALITLSLQAHYRYTPMFSLGYEPDLEKVTLSTLTRDELTNIPLYRRAKRRHRLSSSKDDMHPALTEHGDFIYFASDRAGGFGDLDIYRSRISGDRPTKPENVGPAINTADKETAPTTRMAGFDLMFCSNRNQGNHRKSLIYSSLSKRVHIKTNPLKIASPIWMLKTFPWRILVIFLAALIFTYWLTKLRKRHKEKASRAPPRSLSLYLLGIVKKWTLPTVCIFVALISVLSIKATLSKTVWRFYTDGEDINRSAMIYNARPVLWNTHITLGELNRPRPKIKPVFSPDETEIEFSYKSKKTKKLLEFTSQWDGKAWSKAKKIEQKEKVEEKPKVDKKQNKKQRNKKQRNNKKNKKNKKAKEKPKDKEKVAVTNAPPPVVIKHSSITDGGYEFFSSDELKGHGGHDIFFNHLSNKDKDDSDNLGPYVNSKDNDIAPAVRMEGFDLMFISDRGQEEENKYVLFSSTAREVIEHMDYSRWHNLMAMLARLKWWIFAFFVAIAGLIYVLKHWKKMNSLFHKCLVGSGALHLVILLFMASWMISAEFVESIESEAMEISVDVDALAQEKLALELEQDVTEMEDIPDAPVVEQQQDAPEISMIQPEVVEDTPEMEVEMSEKSFVEEMEPLELQELETEMPEMKELDPLPEIEMPEFEVKLEMEEAPEEEPTETQEEEVEATPVQEEIEVVQAETEQTETEQEVAETEMPELTEPKMEVTPVEIPLSQEPAPVPEPVEVTMTEPELTPMETLPEMAMPEMQLEVQKTEVSEKTEEFKPKATQEGVEIEQAEHEQPTTEAVSPVIETAQLSISNIVQSVEVSELSTETSTALTETEKPIENVPDQVFSEIEIALEEVELETIERPETTASEKTEAFKPKAQQENIEVAQAENERASTEADSTPVETAQVSISKPVEQTALSELTTEIATSETKTEKLLENVPDQVFSEIEVAIEEVELETIKRPETTASAKAEAFKPKAQQENIEVAKAENERASTEADSTPVETAQVNISAAVKPTALSEVTTKTATSQTKTEKPLENIPDQVFSEIELALEEVELEAVKVQGTTATAEKFEQKITQNSSVIQKANIEQTTTDASASKIEISEISPVSKLIPRKNQLVAVKTTTVQKTAEAKIHKLTEQLSSTLPDMKITDLNQEMETPKNVTVTAKAAKFKPVTLQSSTAAPRERTALPSSKMAKQKTDNTEIKTVSAQQPLNKKRIMDSETIRTTFSSNTSNTAKLTDTPPINQNFAAIKIDAPSIEMEAPSHTTATAKTEAFKPTTFTGGTSTARHNVNLSSIKPLPPRHKKPDVSITTAIQVADNRSVLDSEVIRMTFSKTKTTQKMPKPTKQTKTADLPSFTINAPTVEMGTPTHTATAVTKATPFKPTTALQSGTKASRQTTRMPVSNIKRSSAPVPVYDIPPKLSDRKPSSKVPAPSRLPQKIYPLTLKDPGELAALPIASDTGPELKIDAPGKLDVPAGGGIRALPHVMKNPSKLSDEIVESLGGSGNTQKSIVESLDWFSSHQEKNGRWNLKKHGGNSAHDVGGTSLILLCYYGWGAKHNQKGPHQATVKRALDWLLSQMLKDGDLRGWALRRYEDNAVLGNMYDHSIATIALCEAYSLTKDEKLLEPSKRAVDFLLKAQNKKLGGWRYKPGEETDTSSLGWAYMALKSAELAGIEVPADSLKKAEDWLTKVAGGKSKGIYGYQKPETKRPAMVATGMFCRQLNGVPPTDPRMHESVSYIATHPLDPKELDFYYMYYGTLVLYQHQGPVWEKWNADMKKILLAKQHKKGRHAGSWDPEMWYGFQMGRAVSTAISTLSLEVYYRMLPMYGFEHKE